MVVDGVLEGVLKLFDGGEVALEDASMDGGKVIFASLELTGADSKEFVGGKWLGKIWHEESGKGNVERENRLDAMGHVEGDVAG